MSKKKIGYLLFGLISFFYRFFPIHSKKAVFYMIHNDHKCGNLKFMYQALAMRKPENTYIFVSKADLFHAENRWKGIFYFYFVLSFHLMTASEIYLNDNFLPLAYMPIRKGVKVVQFWHGVGAFKRFGLSTEQNSEVRELVRKGNKRLTHLFVSGKEVVPFYEEAFQVSRDKIFPVGLPVLDFYFDNELKKKARENFYAQFRDLSNKKILLYTPTFRKTMSENKALLEIFAVHELKKALGKEWVILMRLHPTILDSALIGKLPEGVYDVSSYQDIKELYEVSDVLVNDYSSTVVEYALLRKPIICFVPDMERYDRGFYRDYEKTSPGKMVKDLDSLVKAVREREMDYKKMDAFLSLQYDYFDRENGKRIMEILFD